MIINGPRYMSTRPNGRKLNNLLCVIIIIMAVISGCSAGRGDWKYQLSDSYALIRFNAHGIQLVYQEAGTTSGEIALDRFFVTDFFVNQDCIGIKGVETAGTWATDEERNSDERVFYLVDLANDKIIGPLSDEGSFWEEFDAVCAEKNEQWQATDKLVP